MCLITFSRLRCSGDRLKGSGSFKSCFSVRSTPSSAVCVLVVSSPVVIFHSSLRSHHNTAPKQLPSSALINIPFHPHPVHLRHPDQQETHPQTTTSNKSQQSHTHVQYPSWPKHRQPPRPFSWRTPLDLVRSGVVGEIERWRPEVEVGGDREDKGNGRGGSTC